jgi:hypothetical protein
MRDFIDETFELYSNPRFVLWMIAATLVLVNLAIRFN